MNSITATVWDVISDHEHLLAELTAIMRKEYKPFFSPAQTMQVNTRQLEQHVLEQLTTWYAWLPDTPIHHIGGELAMDVLDAVEWSLIAERLLASVSQAEAVLSSGVIATIRRTTVEDVDMRKS